MGDVADSTSIHDRTALAHYFDRAVKRPWYRPPLRGTNGDVNVAVPVQGVPIKVALPFGRMWRAATEPFRYRFAAWQWVRPHEPCHAISDLEQIRHAAGLDDVDRQTFGARLIEACKEMKRVHPPLARWIDCRVAALEYLADPPKTQDQQLSDLAITLRTARWRAHHLAWVAPDIGVEKVELVLEHAMHGAAIAVTQSLGVSSDSSVSANLMLPFSDVSDFTPNANWEEAARLWAGLDATRRLIIVAETQGSTHTGFWVPTVRGERNAVLPGAPRAFIHLKGDVVFKDDLPPLLGYGEAVEARWRAFMTERFRQRLFISLPFVAPNGTGGYVAPAVLNVNADADDVSRWRRAYHPEWLAIARERAQPFVEIALSAWLIILNRRNPEARLDTGSQDWDTLPTLGPQPAAGVLHDGADQEDPPELSA